MRVMKKVEVTDNDATPMRGLSLPATRESYLGDSSPMRFFLQLRHVVGQLQWTHWAVAAYSRFLNLGTFGTPLGRESGECLASVINPLDWMA